MTTTTVTPDTPSLRDQADGHTPPPALCPGCGSDNISKRAGEVMVCRDCGGHAHEQEFWRAGAAAADREQMQDGGEGYVDLLNNGAAR